jgi:hypothetical protein
VPTTAERPVGDLPPETPDEVVPEGRPEALLPEPPDGGGVRLVAVPLLAAPAGRGRD